MGIKCCKDCVAPKRHIGCHGECSEYIQEKQELDREKQELFEKRQTYTTLYEQRYQGVTKALKRRRK